jgi:hypothetical protein
MFTLFTKSYLLLLISVTKHQILSRDFFFFLSCAQYLCSGISSAMTLVIVHRIVIYTRDPVHVIMSDQENDISSCYTLRSQCS